MHTSVHPALLVVMQVTGNPTVLRSIPLSDRETEPVVSTDRLAEQEVHLDVRRQLKWDSFKPKISGHFC